MFWIGMLIGAMLAAPVGFFTAVVMASSGSASDQEDAFERMQREARKAGS